MKLPLILCDNGDVALFESVAHLECYLESPDIGGYRVFDASGDVLQLTTVEPVSDKKGWLNLVRVAPVRIDVGESRMNAADELEERLRSFLSRVTGKSYNQSALPELLTVLQATIEFACRVGEKNQ